jgi:HipA-like kinase
MTNALPKIRTVNVTRYVTPLREGSSLPAIVEADDDGLYVLKFRGAGQGVKALIAELVAGEIARSLGLRVPEIVFANLDAALSQMEPDPEIQDLLHASAGLNLAMDFLPGSVAYTPLAEKLDAKLASQIVWFDCLVTNIDRTPRNSNLLLWHKNVWLIDHGASLYFQHAWENWKAQSHRPFIQVKDHVLLRYASKLDSADAELRARLTSKVIGAIVALIPDDWLSEVIPPGNASLSSEGKRDVYVAFLEERVRVSGTLFRGDSV